LKANQTKKAANRKHRYLVNCRSEKKGEKEKNPFVSVPVIRARYRTSISARGSN